MNGLVEPHNVSALYEAELQRLRQGIQEAITLLNQRYRIAPVYVLERLLEE